MQRQATHDVNEIVDYLFLQGKSLPPLFQEELRDTLETLTLFPLGYRVKWKGYREVQVGRFKILVIYKVQSNKVWIHRLVHAARRPSARYKSTD